MSAPEGLAPALRAVWKAAALAGCLLVLLPSHALFAWRGKGHVTTRAWHRAVCAILGLKAEIAGTPALPGRVLYVGNHLSHLDVPVLGSHLCASFVAKDEVAGWPVLGWMARMQQTIFISRDRRCAAAVRETLRCALRRDKSMILFPEGTSSRGEVVLPFRSGAFSAFVFRDVTVQPFTIDLLEIDGQRVQDGAMRDIYAYYGDMVLLPHLWSFLKRRGAALRITFHPPLAAAALCDRKYLSRAAYAAVSAGLEAA